MAQPLEVLADLRLAVEGEEIDIQAEGNRIIVDLPSLQAGRRMLAAEPLARNRSQATRRVQEALRTSGLSVEVRLEGAPFLRMGKGVRSGRLERLVGLPGVEVEPAPAVRAAVRRRPVLTTVVVLGLAILIGTLLFRALRS